MTSAVPAIEFIDVHTALGGEWVLRGVNFAIARDRITVLLGPSGVGKTTTLRHLLGLLEPDEGEVLIEGRPLRAMRRREREDLAKRFGVLLQSTAGIYGSALWGSMTLEDNIVYQLRQLRGGDQEELRVIARERLDEVGLLSSADQLPEEVSSGSRKRAALARALASDPDFAVLDDFDTGVDGVRAIKLCEMVRRRQALRGGAYVITTHDMEIARRLADDVVVMMGGRIVEAGAAAEVFGSADAGVRQLVSGARTGPIALRDSRSPPSGGPPDPRPDQSIFDIPPWLASAVVLIAITASVLWLSGRGAVELAVVVILWAGWAVTLAARHRDG